ncbi:MAG: carboxypeptidase-like regulatory domain-containing protein, partial [Vicinamibacterales bacterium]
MQRARSFDGDLRALTQTTPVRRRERPEREAPEVSPVPLPGTIPVDASAGEPVAPGAGIPPAANAPAPGPVASFDGLDFATWGAGHPPDTNGDVGPAYYIETINTSIGIYDKANGVRVAAFTFNTFMSQGNFGNLCDTNNFGDPVVLYDTFEDRWVITDFAFSLDASGNVINPPGAFQCFAVSKSGDPVSGGWNFYSVNTTGGLGDYPKLGIWPDGLYMSINIFDYSAAGSFQNVRLYALNKAQMYAGAASIQVVSFDAPPSEFTLLPANARLQTGTPPAGSPNYFASVWNYLNVVGVWKFHVDWNHISTSTLTGPFNSITSNNWSQLTSGTVPSPANQIDTLRPRLMMQNQYTNLGGVESLWDSHSAGASGVSSTQAAVRYYQVNVTGSSVAAAATQAFTYAPDAALHRFLPSVAVDRAGNLAIGYSTSSATQNPSIRYAGRLAADPVNSITQTETVLFLGTGSQSGTCGGAPCTRWGDYSAMTLDPDGCTFWYANEYYQVTGLNHRTRISAFSLPGCVTIGGGALQGTVKTTTGVPIAGASVALGSRTATTDASGNYSFTDLPAGS